MNQWTQRQIDIARADGEIAGRLGKSSGWNPHYCWRLDGRRGGKALKAAWLAGWHVGRAEFEKRKAAAKRDAARAAVQLLLFGGAIDCDQDVASLRAERTEEMHEGGVGEEMEAVNEVRKPAM
jgi:hypothetical protein